MCLQSPSPAMCNVCLFLSDVICQSNSVKHMQSTGWSSQECNLHSLSNTRWHCVQITQKQSPAHAPVCQGRARRLPSHPAIPVRIRSMHVYVVGMVCSLFGGDGPHARGRHGRGENAIHGNKVPPAGGEGVLRPRREAGTAMPSVRVRLVVVEGPLTNGNKT